MGFRGHVSRLWLDKATNREVATKYYLYQYRRYRDWEKAIAAYNAGSVRGHIRNRSYVRKVMRAINEN